MLSTKALFLAMLAGCMGTEMLAPAVNMAMGQPPIRAPRASASSWVSIHAVGDTTRHTLVLADFGQRATGAQYTVHVVNGVPGWARPIRQATATLTSSFHLINTTAWPCTDFVLYAWGTRGAEVSRDSTRIAAWRLCRPVDPVEPPSGGGVVPDTVTAAPNGEVYFRADFSDCSSTAQVGSLTTSSDGTGDAVGVTRTNPYPGGACSAEFTFAGNADPADDAWAEWRFRLTKPVTEAWVGWSIYYPGPGDVGKGTAVYVHRNVSPNNNKLLRLWDEDYSAYKLKLGFSTTAAAISTVITEQGVNGSGVGPSGISGKSNAITASHLGRWMRFQAHVKTATSANNDGAIELYQDGVRIISNTAVAMYPSGGAGNYLRNGYIMGWANSGFSATTKIWVARVIVASTKALTD